MTDNYILWCIKVCGGALIVMFLVGWAVLQINGVNELDKKCLKETRATIGECFREYYRSK